MGDDEKNDYDRIADDMGEILATLVGNAHDPIPHQAGSDSVTITKDGLLSAVIQLQRLRNWTEGLAATHRKGGEGPHD